MRYAVVTGSTKGIGKAVAEKLLSEGWYVFVNYAKDDIGAKEFAEAHKGNRDQFKIIKCELSSYDNAQAFVKEVLDTVTCIDCLVLNSGITDVSPVEEITKEKWEHVMNTNVNVPFYITQGLYNNIAADRGRVIFIGSICGVYPHARSLAYGVSKAAVHQMAKELVKFFEPKRITVNAVITGFVETSWQNAKSPDHRKRIEDKIALHRFAHPEEIASLCWEMINNPYINGANVRIDGGYCYC